MADLLIQPGRGPGVQYRNIEDPGDTWHWLENPPADATDGIPYAFTASLGDVSRPAPFLYTVELDIAEADLPAIFAWYEQEHLPMLTSCPGKGTMNSMKKKENQSAAKPAAPRFSSNKAAPVKIKEVISKARICCERPTTYNTSAQANKHHPAPVAGR